MLKRIGLYGGSFDPVHLGHLLVAQAAREEWGLDRIFFIPAAQSPFKPDRQMAAAPTRLMLLHLALVGRTDTEVDPQEIIRGGISYTIDTIRDYRSRFPQAELFFLVGADHVPLLPKWRDSAELGKMVQFLVIPRPGEVAVTIPGGFQGCELTGFPLGVSSSQIRSRIAAGLEIELLTGSAVAEAIKNNGLYL
ncbi:MAG: nicotinate (nicotinamide) nucleotide adenylyltransferase [Verrucomicrobiales bacterium]|nr:nicotinate (nicotinamide) nucleotide adenylyltransferase [Verrucomicrobiales bacterium]